MTAARKGIQEVARLLKDGEATMGGQALTSSPSGPLGVKFLPGVLAGSDSHREMRSIRGRAGNRASAPRGSGGKRISS